MFTQQMKGVAVNAPIDSIAPQAHASRAVAWERAMARKKKSQHERRSAIPIVNEHAQIVGWTTVDPENRGGTLWHEEAQRLLGEILPCYVSIEDPEAVLRAGAPAGWVGAWRCLAICSDRIRRKQGIDGDEALTTVSMRPAKI